MHINLGELSPGALRRTVEVSTDMALKKVYHLMYSELNRIGKRWWVWFREKMDLPKHGRVYELPEWRGRYGYRGEILKMNKIVWVVNEETNVATPTLLRDEEGNIVKVDAYRASAEGEYPATVTGNLLENLTFKIHEPRMGSGPVPKNSVLTMVITTGASYSEELQRMDRKMISKSVSEFWYGEGMNYVRHYLRKRLK